MNQTIDVKNLSVSYSGKKAIKDVNFSLDSGRLIGIIGPNGAGKSTLVKGMLDLEKKDSGKVRIFGKELDTIREKIAYIPQRADIDWDFPILVKSTVLLGRYPRLGLFKRPSKKDKKIALEALEKVGMADFADNQIGQLSGGQQQRVFVARSLAQKADVYFLDEPFVGVDIQSEEIIINILKELRDQGKTIFVIHHDLTQLENYFDDIILINKELFGAGPVKEVVTPELMEAAFKAPLTVLENAGGQI
ncbi:MAG: metal ABC transporter ATP-binding protein [Atopostipes suicloacalis]|nr:metal ABC transporter ATP-binding protein [Atopostipes suicloacalis]